MSDTTTTRCSICNHPDREQIESQLMRGIELRALVGQMNGSVSTSALSRHATSHLQPALREQAQDTEAAPVDLLQRLLAVADDARAARLRARDSGTPVQETRSADLEVKVLGALLGQYGITDTTTAAALADAERLVKSIGRFAISNPTAAQGLIREIRSQKLDEFADQLEEIITKKHPSIERTAS